MAVTSGVRFTHYATLTPSLPMAFYVKWSLLNNRKKNLRPSESDCEALTTQTQSSHRERREHRVFMQLLRMVPGLDNRLMNGSEEEAVHVADLVRLMIFPYIHILIPYADPKGRFKRKIGRYEEPQERHLGLDHTKRTVSEPSSDAKRQGRSRISPRTYWSIAMPSGP
jgi:hypothetical protein